ncbi:MAG: hemin uptake protein HemP [Pseudomonadota bacterium]
MTTAIKPQQDREPPPAPRLIDSEELLQGRKRITINHEGTEYTLHLTRQNKLLLTK